MTGPDIIACLIIGVFVGLIAALDDSQLDRADHALKVGLTVFIVGLLITALCG